VITRTDISQDQMRSPDFMWFGSGKRAGAKSLAVDLLERSSRCNGVTLILSPEQAMDLWLTLADAMKESGQIQEEHGPVPAEAVADGSDVAP
jgi:hypothetical protein